MRFANPVVDFFVYFMFVIARAHAAKVVGPVGCEVLVPPMLRRLPVRLAVSAL